MGTGFFAANGRRGELGAVGEQHVADDLADEPARADAVAGVAERVEDPVALHPVDAGDAVDGAADRPGPSAVHRDVAELGERPAEGLFEPVEEVLVAVVALVGTVGHERGVAAAPEDAAVGGGTAEVHHDALVFDAAAASPS